MMNQQMCFKEISQETEPVHENRAKTIAHPHLLLSFLLSLSVCQPIEREAGRGKKTALVMSRGIGGLSEYVCLLQPKPFSQIGVNDTDGYMRTTVQLVRQTPCLAGPCCILGANECGINSNSNLLNSECRCYAPCLVFMRQGAYD